MFLLMIAIRLRQKCVSICDYRGIYLNKKNTREIGNKYELMASQYLEKKGLVILEKNFRTRYSEIDIIARDGDTYVFCEVKYRSNDFFGSPFDAVDLRKQKRISRAAMYYCMSKNIINEPCRFDVIAIYGNGKIEHIEDAFYGIE